MGCPESLEAGRVFGVLIALAASPQVGLAFGFGLARGGQRLLKRVTRRVHGPIRAGEWAMSAALSLSTGTDGQKAMGVIAALPLAGGQLQAFAVPLWAELGSETAQSFQELNQSRFGTRIVAA